MPALSLIRLETEDKGVGGWGERQRGQGDDRRRQDDNSSPRSPMSEFLETESAFCANANISMIIHSQ